VTVTGPRPSVDKLKDGDIKATADVSGVTSNQPSVPVRITYEMPKAAPDIMLEGAQEFTKVQVFREKTRVINVEAVFKHDSPAGLRYGLPKISPSRVSVTGREDYVNRVDRVEANASPSEPQANIDGDFAVVARDSDRNAVDGVTIKPEKVHVTVPQVLLPSEQLFDVQAVLSDRPADPYFITDKVFTPNQVKVIGTPKSVAAITGIYTETLSVHDLTSTTTIDASLILPPDVQVRDTSGKPITHVKVTFVIAKRKPDGAASPESSPPAGGAKHEGPSGP